MDAVAWYRDCCHRSPASGHKSPMTHLIVWPFRTPRRSNSSSLRKTTSVRTRFFLKDAGQ